MDDHVREQIKAATEVAKKGLEIEGVNKVSVEVGGIGITLSKEVTITEKEVPEDE